MSKEEKALSDAYAEFNNQVNDLRLDFENFKGPFMLKMDDRKFKPRMNHVLYGWNNIIKKQTIWIYVEVDTTFQKKPSVSFSNNFFEISKK